MLYLIKSVEKKNNDWIVASLAEAAGGNRVAYDEVSINRIDKKTGLVAFPTFDEIQAGREIEGEIWQSPKGAWYLFAPRKAKTAQNGAYKQKMIEDTMKKKEDSITHFQASKEESIKLASAQRDAVLIVTTLLNHQKVNSMESWNAKLIQEKIIEWRNWFLNDSEFNNPPPF